MLLALILVKFSVTPLDCFAFGKKRIVINDSIGCSAAPVIEAGAICVHTYDGSAAPDLSNLQFLNMIDSSANSASGIVFSASDEAYRTLTIKTMCLMLGDRCSFASPTPVPVN